MTVHVMTADRDLNPRREKMPTYTGINHLAMVTDDMDKTIRFWRDLLGMRLVAGLGRNGYRHYFFEISETDMIAFFQWSEVDNISKKGHGEPVKGPIAFDHVSIGVEDDDALWALKDLLQADGHWVSEVVDHGFIHSIYAYDPNQIPIEFSAPVPDVDVRKEPRIKDHSPCKTAREGSEPLPERRPDVRRSTPRGERVIHKGAGAELAEKP